MTTRIFLTAFLLTSVAFAQTWTELSPSGTPPVARGGTTGVYDPTTDRMIVFGGRGAGGDNRNDVWVLTHANGEGATGQWIRLIADGAAGSPPARSGHSAVYDSVNNRMIIFGGCSASCAPVLNDVWVLTNANGVGGTPVWAQLQLSGGPAARTNAAVTYNAPGNQLIVFGGQDGSANPCSTYSDVWTLSNANGLGGSPAWMSPSLGYGSTVPPGQNGATAVYGSATGVIVVFGGTGLVNGTCQATNAVWVLGIDGAEVYSSSRVPNGAAGAPPARSFHSAVYDATFGRMLVFGGVDGSGNYLNDVWSLSDANGYGFVGWSMLSPTGGPPQARSGQAAIFDSANHRMTIFAGADATGALNDSWVLNAPSRSEMTCTANSGVPNLARAQGMAEQVGDAIVECTGGVPTPQGEPIPEYYITMALNTNITSRLLPEAAGLTEALLLIDEPFPASPVPPDAQPAPSQPPQILCTPLGSECAETGTGGTPSPYQTQPNVFAGKQSNATTLYWKIPIDPPGPNVTRVIRLTNVRANASQLGLPSGLIALLIQANVGLQGFYPLPLAVANAVPGVLESGFTSASIPQCEPHNAALLGGSGTAAFDFSTSATEGFAQDFKYRNYGTYLSGPVFPPVLAEQNVPGFVYGTETGFYSPSLFTPAPTLGLADFGTRILVSVGPVSAGTKLFVPTTITLTGEYGQGTPPGQLQLVQANEYGNSAAGYEPVAATAMVGTTPVAEASTSGSTAYAVYEVIYANQSVQETATIPVAVAFTNVPSTGNVEALTTLAPLSSVGTASESASIPRFANFSTALTAYSITSCAGALQ
jgi:hypothetical protein